jgi:hypothetical protein
MSLEITLRRNSDGRAVFHSEEAFDGWHYAWSGGNYGCDCNRQLFFDRALGLAPAIGDAVCGEDAYTVLLITDDSTGAIVCAGDPRDVDEIER